MRIDPAMPRLGRVAHGMPAKSKKQQMAAGAALAAKRGESSKKTLKGASRQMAESMSEKQLEDVAKTKRKKLPTRKTPAKSAKSKPAKKTGPAKRRAKT